MLLLGYTLWWESGLGFPGLLFWCLGVRKLFFVIFFKISVIISNSIAYIWTLCCRYPIAKMGFYEDEGIMKGDWRDDSKI